MKRCATTRPPNEPIWRWREAARIGAAFGGGRMPVAARRREPHDLYQSHHRHPRSDSATSGNQEAPRPKHLPSAGSRSAQRCLTTRRARGLIPPRPFTPRYQTPFGNAIRRKIAFPTAGVPAGRSVGDQSRAVGSQFSLPPARHPAPSAGAATTRRANPTWLTPHPPPTCRTS